MQESRGVHCDNDKRCAFGRRIAPLRAQRELPHADGAYFHDGALRNAAWPAECGEVVRPDEVSRGRPHGIDIQGRLPVEAPSRRGLVNWDARRGPRPVPRRAVCATIAAARDDPVHVLPALGRKTCMEFVFVNLNNEMFSSR